MSARNPDLIEVIERSFDVVLDETHQMIPAKVIDFTASPSPYCTVQIARRMRASNGQHEAIEPISDVPLYWPSYGDFLVCGTIEKGDEVILMVPSKSIEEFREAGDMHDQGGELRRFAFEDAIALPCRLSRPISRDIAQILQSNPGIFYLGDKSETAYLKIDKATKTTEIEGAAIKVGKNASRTVTGAGDTVSASAGMVTWMGQVATAINAISSGAITPPAPVGFGVVDTGNAKAKLE